MTVSMLVNVVLPIMSGFFITQSMQKEYGEKTIINIVTAPVNRKTFVLSKIAVWFCWCFVVMMVTECLTIVGSLMCTLVFVLLQSIGAQVSEELLPVASFVPWLAIQISTMLPQNSQYLYICIASVLCAGIVGIGLSLHEFNKQDL